MFNDCLHPTNENVIPFEFDILLQRQKMQIVKLDRFYFCPIQRKENITFQSQSLLWIIKWLINPNLNVY